MTNQNGTAQQAQAAPPVQAVKSARFVAEVERQFTAQMGSALSFTDYEKTLAQHLFLKIDAQLKHLESRRRNQNAAPITWENVNMQQLALDAVHTVNLGVDALIPNHVHPIPYWNSRIKKYDLDLRLGYVGKLYARRQLAVERPVDVIIELVHETDEFVPYMKSATNEVEGYEFKITNPFDRGKVIGGFGYIVYEDPRKNKLILVTKRDFEKAKAAAQTQDFWASDKWEQEMQYKTVVHRVADALPMDPRKVNAASYAYMEAKEAEDSFERAIITDANGEVIDVESGDYTVTDGEISDEEFDRMLAEDADDPAMTSEPTQSSLLEGPGF